MLRLFQVWPAFWTYGKSLREFCDIGNAVSYLHTFISTGEKWPNDGEIDILGESHAPNPTVSY